MKELNEKELRIGNYLQTYKGKYLELTHIQRRDDELILLPLKEIKGKLWGYYQLKDVKPIPLNEEWLIKFGFVKIDRCFHKIDFGFYAKKVKDSIGFHIKRNDLSIEIQYVNQLQNLYFALTGEELEIQ